jgi:hypothetical protein
MNDPNASTHRSSRAVAISDRAYRILLAAYPAEFRRRYGPEMAQVLRTSCQIAYHALGAGGVLRLWPGLLWDWAWSAADERFASLMNASRLKDSVDRFMKNQSVTLSLFLVALCLPCSLLSTLASVMGNELCQLQVDNQSGETLRVTALDVSGSSPIVARSIRTSWPEVSAIQQRNITVKSGEVRRLAYECARIGQPAMVACDSTGVCYLDRNPRFLEPHTSENESAISFNGFRFTSLELLPHPDQAMLIAIASTPEQDYSGVRQMLVASIPVFALLLGLLRVVRARKKAVQGLSKSS